MLGAKGRVWVSDPSEAPRGVQLSRGPRGGLYYESSAAAFRVKPVKVSAPKPKAPKKGGGSGKPKAPKAEKRAIGQPFGSADDPGLPGRIKRESQQVREAWVGAFNDTLKAGGSEADALAAANKLLPNRKPPKPAKEPKAAKPKQPKRDVGQPFNGANDARLPLRVRQESDANRGKWVSAFNASLRAGQSEREALAAANAAIAPPKKQPAKRRTKEGGMTEEFEQVDCEHGVGLKCAMCEQPALAVWRPFGAARSFDDYDRWKQANETEMAVREETEIFNALVNNILTAEDMDLAEKASAIEKAAGDLKSRLTDPVMEHDDEGGMKEVGILARLLGHKAAATKTEGGVTYKASDYADVGDPQKPSTWKLRLAEGRSGNVTVAQVARAITAMQPGGFRGQKVQMMSDKAAVMAKIMAAIDRAKGDDAGKASLRKRASAVKEYSFEWDAPEVPSGTFSAFKDAAGQWRWLTIFSNRFQDREGEIFSEAAHREFSEYLQASKEYPELRLWHVPGSRIGEADSVGYDDAGFMVATGTFDPGYEAAALRLKEAGQLGVSHGYLYRKGDLRDGVYHRYRSFEISVLPLDRAANQLTAAQVTGPEESEMTLRQEQKDFLARVLGPDRVAALESTIGTLAEKATAEGINFKDLTDALAEPAPATPAAAVPGAAAATAPGAPAGDAETVKALKEIMGPVLAAIEEVKTKQTEQAAAIAELKKSDDEKLAALITPRAQPGAKAASESADNVVRSNSQVVTQATKSAEGIDDHLAYYRKALGIPSEQPA